MTDLSDLLRDAAAKLSQSTREPNILMYKPHDKQKHFHLSTDFARLYIGGNRSGKTYGAVVEDIWWCTGTHPFIETPPPPIRGRVVAPSFDQGIELTIIPLFKRLCAPSMLKGGTWESAYRTKAHILEFANGSTIEFMSYDQEIDKFSGTSRHFIHFDEEPPKGVFDECLMRVADTEGRYWVSMTPVDGITWLYDAIYEPVLLAPDKEVLLKAAPNMGQIIRSEARQTIIVEVDQEENPHLSALGRARSMMTLDEDDKEARKSGKFVEMSGLVYKAFDPKIHVIAPFIPPLDWDWYTSTDHGWNNPTATLWHAVAPNGDVITFAEQYASGKTVEEHATAMTLKEAAWGKEPEMRVGDPAMKQANAVTGTNIITEYARHGIYISVDNIPRSVEIGVIKIQQYLKINPRTNKPKWFITENCVNLIREMRRLRWKKYESKKKQGENNKSEQIHKKDDHACDSARYFFTCMPDLTPEDYIDPDAPDIAAPKFNADYGAALLKAVTEGRPMPQNDEWQLYEGVDLAELFE